MDSCNLLSHVATFREFPALQVPSSSLNKNLENLFPRFAWCLTHTHMTSCILIRLVYLRLYLEREEGEEETLGGIHFANAGAAETPDFQRWGDCKVECPQWDSGGGSSEGGFIHKTVLWCGFVH